MQNPNRRPLLFVLGIGALLTGAGAAHFGLAQPQTPRAAQQSAVTRPLYDIRATLDYELLTLSARANITVPAGAGDPLSDAAFFLYANADGVGGAGETRKNLKVESVSVDGAPVKWQLDEAVLHVQLPSPRTVPFVVEINYKGVVPRSQGDDGMMGGLMSADISGMLGLPGGDDKTKVKAKNTDYGLYTASRGIVSLGAFWYPTLAVRQNKKWADDAPNGLGDVAYAVKSDYRVSLQVPKNVTVVAPGSVTRGADGAVQIRADDVRECAVLMSQGYLVKSKTVDVAGRPVRVDAYARPESAAKLDQSLDVASRALQIYAKRFGPYNFDSFKVVEAPMKSGAGGMEYSAMTGIASGLYGDMGKELGGMMTTLNLPGASELLGSLGDDTLGATPKKGDENNPMAGVLGNVLGQQKEMLDSLLETTIAHEVAHQWWAIGVGSDSQKHPFLDESLTNWSAMLYYEDRYGPEKARQMSDLNLNTSFSMGAMLGGGDKPANLPTAAYNNNLQYGAVIYGKGALFYAKLRALMGDEAFFGGLRKYYARFDDKLAGPGDLKAIMIAQAPAKKAQIEALYTRWVDGAHGQEDIGGGALGGLDLSGLLGGIMGGGLGGEQ